IDRGDVVVKFIPRDETKAQILVENKTKRPLTIRLPDAFVGAPVLAQFNGFGNQRGNNNGGGNGFQFGNQQGGGNQSVGGQLNGGNNGFFNIPPERTRRLVAACVCLDHGKPNPNPRIPYTMMRPESHLDRPEVVELLRAFSRENLDRRAVQAAAWHLNNDLSWEELADMTTGRQRLIGGEEPYFTVRELKAAKSIAAHAQEAANQPTNIAAATGR
ncbi:MAG: hypothetical protein KDA42_19690, partial [Planctomycetales bacterium]|nr:hypothetical protein [Planctomycetales bacterium]